jgi:hypothetical protein
MKKVISFMDECNGSIAKKSRAKELEEIIDFCKKKINEVEEYDVCREHYSCDEVTDAYDSVIDFIEEKEKEDYMASLDEKSARD